VKERETLAIVEFSVKVDGLGTEVKAVKETRNSARTLLAVRRLVDGDTASVYRLSLTRAYSVA